MAGEGSKQEKMCSELAVTHFTIRKINFDKNSGVQKVQNWINRGIQRNSERIFQPRLMLRFAAAKVCLGAAFRGTRHGR
jgi:hypothetical protein